MGFFNYRLFTVEYAAEGSSNGKLDENEAISYVYSGDQITVQYDRKPTPGTWEGQVTGAYTAPAAVENPSVTVSAEGAMEVGQDLAVSVSDTNLAQIIRAQIAETTSDYDREKLQERVAKLAGGVAVIGVGAATEVEMKERKMRIEDALAATRAAVEEGIVPGGGVALLSVVPAVKKACKNLEGDVKTGANIVISALEAPIRQIAANAGVDGGVVAATIIRRGKERLLRHDQARHPRPDQGHEKRVAECGVRGGDPAHHRSAGDRHQRAHPCPRNARRRHGRHVLSRSV